MRQGSSVREFLVLASGSALVTRDDQPDVLLRPGDWFGDGELLAKSTASATVIALTDVELIVMSYGEFIGLVDAITSFRRRLVTALAERLHQPQLPIARGPAPQAPARRADRTSAKHSRLRQQLSDLH